MTFELSEADWKLLESWPGCRRWVRNWVAGARGVGPARRVRQGVGPKRLKISPNTVAACRRRYREGEFFGVLPYLPYRQLHLGPYILGDCSGALITPPALVWPDRLCYARVGHLDE